MDTQVPRQLKRFGMLLILLALITGLCIMQLKNPRMGLAAHVTAILNGLLLVAIGFLWPELKLAAGLKKVLFLLLVFAAYASLLLGIAGGLFGTSRLTPLGGNGFAGTPWQENLVAAGLFILVPVTVFAIATIVYGLRGKES